VRARGGKDLGAMSLDAFVQHINSDIANKSLV
jgi:threonyl-tRNA synthetase